MTDRGNTGTERSLDREIAEGLTGLLELVSQSSTSAVAGMCFVYLLSLDSRTTHKRRLSSPAKQIPLLLAVLLSTGEPQSPIEFDGNKWDRVIEILNRLFLSYLSLFRPSSHDVGASSSESNRVHEVAMLSFLHYFNTGLLASVEQVKERIRTYVAPFDVNLKDVVGIGAQEALDVCDYIAHRLQGDVDGVQRSAEDDSERRKELLQRASRERWSADELSRIVKEEGHAASAMRVFEGIRRLGLVSIQELRSRFPSVADVFWREFTIGRGEAPKVQYPTEKSATETKPLIRISDSESFCLSSNSLFEAILRRSELELLRSSHKDRFLRARDRLLEQETLTWMKRLLGPGATYWPNVYETPDSKYEHDFIAEDEHLCLVVEVKATPPAEPFRDADKAFTRLRDAFRADTGIQKAYDQANRVVSRLASGQEVQLFDREGKELGHLVPRTSVLPMCVCVTRDNYGPLATNLSLLLEKGDGDAYPWVTNILDLRTLAEAWSFLGLGSKEFRRYLEQRVALHGKVFSEDELDFAGCFLQHEGLRHLMDCEADLIDLNPDYSSVFDKIYRHVHLDGPPVVIEPTDPVLMDLGRSLKTGQPVFVAPRGRPKRMGEVGRNQPCPCGSGRKYKRCCGR